MLRQKKINRLFFRFLISYLVMVFIPILALGIYIYHYFFEYMKNTLETTRHSSLVQVCAAHDTLFSQMEAIADQIYLSDSFHKFELEKTPEKALGIIEELNILNQTCSYLDEIVFH